MTVEQPALRSCLASPLVVFAPGTLSDRPPLQTKSTTTRTLRSAVASASAGIFKVPSSLSA